MSNEDEPSLYEALNLLVEEAYGCTDVGPPGEGWKSDSLERAFKLAERALAKARNEGSE